MTAQDFQRLDVVDSLELTILGVKVWRRMVVEVQVDHDAEEG
jgi:hypothetical protein